jgi:hypothetical protein
MINEIYTFDNIVDIEIQNEIENYVYDKNLNWEIKTNVKKTDGVITKSFPAQVISTNDINKNILKLIDIIIDNSLNKINKKLLKKYRIRINKTIPHIFDLKEEYKLLHIDLAEAHITMIYYINDSDGDTLIFNNKNNEHLNNITDFINNDNFLNPKNFELTKSISPKKGRVVMFAGNSWHYGKYPTKGERNIININLVIENPKSII